MWHVLEHREMKRLARGRDTARHGSRPRPGQPADFGVAFTRAVMVAAETGRAAALAMARAAMAPGAPGPRA